MLIFNRGFAAIVILMAASGSPAWASSLAHDESRMDRLAGLAKLWAAIEYFHPFLAYRQDIDWDAALLEAIPESNSAETTAAYAAAVSKMLSALNDPATYLVNPAAPAPPEIPIQRAPFSRRGQDSVEVISMRNYHDMEDFPGTLANLALAAKEIESAAAVVVDLRPNPLPPEDETGDASSAIMTSDLPNALIGADLDMPGERRRMHQGFTPQEGATSGGYSSGFYLQGQQQLKAAPAAKGRRAVFLIGPGIKIPPIALGLQNSGAGAIVFAGTASDEGAISTLRINLPYGLKAQIRLGELVYPNGTGGFTPNLTVPATATAYSQDAALQAAIDLARKGNFSPPAHQILSEQAAAQPNRTYSAAPYPPMEQRVLGAIRFWAVIDNFYPYKDLMGEDWDNVLRAFIPKMESAGNALDYNLAIAEMGTHVHDNHVGEISATLGAYFGTAATPVRVRIIEGAPVITAYTNSKVATDVGLEIGDIILKLDGEEARSLIDRRLKYTSRSTIHSGSFRASERSLTRGGENSQARYTILDPHNQIREITVIRKAEFLSPQQGDRTGDVMRIVASNIGYADLDRLTVPQVDEMFEKFKNCPAIIFDDRGYPNGTAWEIAPRLTDRSSVAAAILRRRDPTAPNLPNGELLRTEDWTNFVQRLPATGKPRYHGVTVLLVDDRTISQAEHTGLFFEAANNTKFIGSPTQGADGDVSYLTVPGGIVISFTGQGAWHADGRPLQRIGLQPELEVYPTIAGIRAGRDEVLDSAVSYVRQRLRLP